MNQNSTVQESPPQVPGEESDLACFVGIYVELPRLAVDESSSSDWVNLTKVSEEPGHEMDDRDDAIGSVPRQR